MRRQAHRGQAPSYTRWTHPPEGLVAALRLGQRVPHDLGRKGLAMRRIDRLHTPLQDRTRTCAHGHPNAQDTDRYRSAEFIQLNLWESVSICVLQRECCWSVAGQEDKVRSRKRVTGISRH
jgi:hypothetical protein